MNSKKALIVEDVMENRYLLSFLLKAKGWEVAEAEDGAKALEVVLQYLPDVILMDIGLPDGLDGYKLAQLLRAIPQLQTVSIIAVTSYAMGGDREMALAAGCDGYIEKPINPLSFLKQVEDVMAYKHNP